MTLTLHDPCVENQGNQKNSFSVSTHHSNTKALTDGAFDKIYTLYNPLPCGCDRAVLLKLDHPTHHAILKCENHLKYIGFVGKDLRSKYFCLETQETLTEDLADRLAQLNQLEGHKVQNQLSLFDLRGLNHG